MIFKHKKDIERVLHLHPVTLIILMDMYAHCLKNEMWFEITSTVSTLEEDEAIGRQSTTHREGRAFDLSIGKWSPSQLEYFLTHFRDKYREYAAKTLYGERVLIPDVNHGTAPHIHVQISRAITSAPVSLDKKLDFLTLSAFRTMVNHG